MLLTVYEIGNKNMSRFSDIINSSKPTMPSLTENWCGDERERQAHALIDDGLAPEPHDIFGLVQAIQESDMERARRAQDRQHLDIIAQRILSLR
jgi:hypothetical protein